MLSDCTRIFWAHYLLQIAGWISSFPSLLGWLPHLFLAGCLSAQHKLHKLCVVVLLQFIALLQTNWNFHFIQVEYSLWRSAGWSGEDVLKEQCQNKVNSFYQRGSTWAFFSLLNTTKAKWLQTIMGANCTTLNWRDWHSKSLRIIEQV